MDTAWLEDFVRLAEEQNFSRAAQARNLSQPAFSRRIRALEEWAGAVLIDRDTHRIGLTPAGDALYVVASEVLRRLALGRDQVAEIAAAQANTLRFASTHALSVTFFPSWFRSFESYQDMGAVALIADNMVACERLMLEGRVDFLLCHHHPAAATTLDPKGFRSVRLGSDTLVPVSAPRDDGTPLYTLPGTAGSPVPCLEFDERSGMGRILVASNVLANEDLHLKSLFRSHLASVLLAIARDGRGVAWSPLSLAESYIKAGAIMPAGGVEWNVPLEVRLVRPRARRSEAVEAFWASLSKSKNVSVSV